MPVVTLLGNLARRSWLFALLWLLLSFLFMRLSPVFGVPVIQFIDIPTLLYQPLLPPPFQMVLALLFSYVWFRSCLRSTGGMPTVSDIRPHNLLWYLLYGCGFLVTAGVVYAVASFLAHRLLADTAYTLLEWTPSIALFVLFTRLLPCLPLILLAPILGRLALVLPAAVAGPPLSPAQAWRLSRGGGTMRAIPGAFAVTLVLVLPVYLRIEWVGQMQNLPPIVEWAGAYLLVMATLAPVLLAVAVLVEILAERYRTLMASAATNAEEHVEEEGAIA